MTLVSIEPLAREASCNNRQHAQVRGQRSLLRAMETPVPKPLASTASDAPCILLMKYAG